VVGQAVSSNAIRRELGAAGRRRGARSAAVVEMRGPCQLTASSRSQTKRGMQRWTKDLMLMKRRRRRGTMWSIVLRLLHQSCCWRCAVGGRGTW
jgi:hypothetical protein